MNGLYPIFAEATTRVRWEWARWHSFTEWWQKPLLVVVCLAIAAFVVYMYRRDSVELKPGVGILLLLLRLAAFGGLLANYLDLQRRTDKLVAQNSQVAVLIDTSASMSRSDGEGTSIPASPTRIERVIDGLLKGELLSKLRQTHDVAFYRFDQEMVRVASFPKAGDGSQPPAPVKSSDQTTLGDESSAGSIAWQQVLLPRGTESRYGQALRQIVNEVRSQPVAGIVLVGDFAQNAGIDQNAGVQLAQEAKIPVYTVGIGSNRLPVNAGIVDFKAPARAYPGDKFQVEALVQAKELAGRNATVELFSRPAGENKDNPGDLGTSLAKESVVLGTNSEISSIKFELAGIKEPGRRILTLRVSGINEDNNPADNQGMADMEVVDRKNTILLFAGGPTREYQFLRNQLKRDRDAVVDILLQNAQPGISQDARKILDDFPSTMQELAEYDTIVAFDPDWRELNETQIDLLDEWVAKESGGLIVVAGPVYMGPWLEVDKRTSPETYQLLAKVRSLYPVEFNSNLLATGDAKFGSQTPWPIQFSREGEEAEFLWLGATAEESQRNWSEFAGVFGFYQVRGPKPGAIVYGRYSDPEASLSEGLPVYFAEQFWGSGRVFYLGSGEMWRLREMGDEYFEQFYTKLLRHVSQGRLLRGSRFGSLLLERDRYIVGNTVVVRAQLSNDQHQPLGAAEVSLQIARPDFTTQTIKLVADKSRKGLFAGQFPVLQPGSYQLELAPADGGEPLTRRLTVTAPQLEVDNPQRNDNLATLIAKGTGGVYFVGMESAVGMLSGPSLAGLLEKRDQSRESYVAEARDPKWDQQWLLGLLVFIVSVLCLEWIIRRLCRLA